MYKKKSTNLEQSKCISFDLLESKKDSSLFNSGVFSFCKRSRNCNKKNEISVAEKTENKSGLASSIRNQSNKELKSSSISKIPVVNKKIAQTQVKNLILSNSSKESKQKSKLSSVGKIRLKFVRKLIKKIKLLKIQNKKYKFLSQSLTHDLNEFTIKQATKPEGNAIENAKILNEAGNKEIVYDIQDTKNNIISTQNNIINNVTVQNNNKFLVQIPEFSSIGSSLDISSNLHSKNFDLNEMSVSSPISFMCKSKYKNINVISLGYYAKNKKLRKSVKNVINGFLSKKKK